MRIAAAAAKGDGHEEHRCSRRFGLRADRRYDRGNDRLSTTRLR
jgi:hypothetical protein